MEGKDPSVITEEEQELTSKMQARLADDGHKIDFDNHPMFDKYTLPRFLRARDLDFDAAYEMFSNHLKWREENGVDSIFETCPKENPSFELLEDYWPGRYMGVDKEGIPVYIERGGQMDAQGMLKLVSIEDVLNYQIYQQEKTMKMKKELSKEKGKNLYGGIVIEDMKGFGTKHVNSATIDFFKAINSINADNYPDTLKRFYCVNSPTYLSVAYKLVKGFIDPVTREKIQVLGSSFFDNLNELIDEDQVPQEYGGGLKMELAGGGKFTGLRSDGTTFKPITDHTVGARDKYSVDVTVEDEGAKLSYSFSTDKDIKFGISKDGENVVKLSKVDSHKNDVSDTIDAKAGTYTFTWDNTDSWMRSKTLNFEINIKSEKKKKKKKSSKDKKSKKKKSNKTDS